MKMTNHPELTVFDLARLVALKEYVLVLNLLNKRKIVEKITIGPGSVYIYTKDSTYFLQTDAELKLIDNVTIHTVTPYNTLEFKLEKRLGEINIAKLLYELPFGPHNY